MVDSTAAPADGAHETRQSVSSQISPDVLQALPKAENRSLRRFRRHRLAVLGLAALSLFALVAILAPFVTFYDPNGIDLTVMRQAPSPAHVLGTDPLGRDVWTRLAYGTRVSLAVGLVAVSIYTTIGVVLGGLAGYFGGRVDMVLSRFTDVMMCFPSFMLIVTVAVVLPPNIFNVMIIIGIFGWTGIMRHVRAQFLTLREREFVLAARCVGVSSGRIVFRHILPNAIAPVVVAATMGLAGAIMTESALELPRPGRPGAHVQLGKHVAGRHVAAHPADDALAVVAVGRRYRHHHPLSQLRRRCIARRARSPHEPGLKY